MWNVAARILSAWTLCLLCLPVRAWCFRLYSVESSSLPWQDFLVDTLKQYWGFRTAEPLRTGYWITFGVNALLVSDLYCKQVPAQKSIRWFANNTDSSSLTMPHMITSFNDNEGLRSVYVFALTDRFLRYETLTLFPWCLRGRPSGPVIWQNILPWAFEITTQLADGAGEHATHQRAGSQSWSPDNTMLWPAAVPPPARIGICMLPRPKYVMIGNNGNNR